MDQVRDELMHYGVLGMRWGKRSANPYTSRIVRGHAGPGVSISARKQAQISRRDLDTLNNGGHLSVGVTKKRQEAYDQRDRKAVEQRLSKAEEKLAKSAKTKETIRQVSQLEVAKGKQIVNNMKTYMNDKRLTSIQKDIDSFKPYVQTGIKDKSGRMIISPDEIKEIIASQEKLKAKYS